MASISSSSSKAKRKNVAFDRTVDDVDEAELFDAKVRTDTTTNSYIGIVKKLKEFLKVPEHLEVPIQLLNDKNYALFSHEFGIQTDHHKSQYKRMCGAINWYNTKYSLPDIFKFPHEWPQFTRSTQASQIN